MKLLNLSGQTLDIGRWVPIAPGQLNRWLAQKIHTSQCVHLAPAIVDEWDVLTVTGERVAKIREQKAAGGQNVWSYGHPSFSVTWEPIGRVVKVQTKSPSVF